GGQGRGGSEAGGHHGGAGSGGELAQHGEPPENGRGSTATIETSEGGRYDAFRPNYSFSRSWEASSGGREVRRSKKPWRAAKSSAAFSWSNSSALLGSSGSPPAATGPEPERSGGSARMISASRAMIRARFSSGVSAAGPSGGSSAVSAAGPSRGSSAWRSVTDRTVAFGRDRR